MGEQVTTSTTFEVEIGLTGTFLKGYPDSRDDPGMADSLEDIEVVAFGGLRLFGPANRYETVSFLTGVDVRNPEVAKLLANIRDFIGEDADVALLAEISE